MIIQALTPRKQEKLQIRAHGEFLWIFAQVFWLTSFFGGLKVIPRGSFSGLWVPLMVTVGTLVIGFGASECLDAFAAEMVDTLEEATITTVAIIW